MLNRTIIFLACFFGLLHASTMSSIAQQTDKYLILIFEDLREYRESGKKIQFKNDYYWVLKFEELKSRNAVPLYIPIDKNTVITYNDSVYLDNTPLSNLNGFAFEEMDHNEYSYGFVKWLHENRIKIQEIKVKNTGQTQGLVKRVKERVNVYYIPVIGGLEKGCLRSDGNNSLAYYPVKIDLMEKATLSEEERISISFLDCSAFNFSDFDKVSSRYQKGFALLRSIK